MSDQRPPVQIIGCSPIGLLGVAFVVLKLCGVINWSWWWVTCPFWGLLAFFGAVTIGAFIIGVVVAVILVILGK